MRARSGLRWFNAAAANPRAAYNTGVAAWKSLYSGCAATVIAAPSGCPANSSLSTWIRMTGPSTPSMLTLGAVPLLAAQPVRIGFFDAVNSANYISTFAGDAVSGEHQDVNIASGTQWTTLTLNLVYGPGRVLIIGTHFDPTNCAFRMEFL